MCINYKVLISTDKGKLRAVNEDNFTIKNIVRESGDKTQHLRANCTSEPLLCAVFDGMGGEKGGREASQISALVAAKLYDYLSSEKQPASEVIQKYVQSATGQIRQFLDMNKLNRGGSTFAMAYLNDGTAELFTMGDSRIYLYRSGRLTRVSRDHTLAQKKYEANIFTLEEAEESSESHILTRFLGMDEESPEFFAESYGELTLDEGDKLLICSDGLYDMCSDEEIRRILSVPDQPYTIQLTDKALENGGEDNVTCIVIEKV